MGKVRARTAIGWSTLGASFAALPNQSLAIANGSTWTLDRSWSLRNVSGYLTSLDIVNGTGLKAVMSTASSTPSMSAGTMPIVWKNLSNFFSEKQTPFRFAARFVKSSPGANTELCGICVQSNSATFGGNGWMGTTGTIGGAAGARHHRQAGATVTNSATLAGDYNCLMVEFRGACARFFVASSPDIVPEVDDASRWSLLSTSTSDLAGSGINLDASQGEGLGGANVAVGIQFDTGNTTGGQTMICTGYKIAVCKNFSLQVT